MQVGPAPGGYPHTLHAKTYKTAGAAARTCAKFNARHPGEYASSSVEHYNANVVHMVERTNLLSGEKFMEPSNTPGFCSPSTETYWSS
jgi:hypothetical protein